VLLEGHGIDFGAVLAEVGPGPAAATWPVPVGCSTWPDPRACQASHTQRACAGQQLLPEHVPLTVLQAARHRASCRYQGIPALFTARSARFAGRWQCTCLMQGAQRVRRLGALACAQRQARHWPVQGSATTATSAHTLQQRAAGARQVEEKFGFGDDDDETVGGDDEEAGGSYGDGGDAVVASTSAEGDRGRASCPCTLPPSSSRHACVGSAAAGTWSYLGRLSDRRIAVSPVSWQCP